MSKYVEYLKSKEKRVAIDESRSIVEKDNSRPAKSSYVNYLRQREGQSPIDPDAYSRKLREATEGNRDLGRLLPSDYAQSMAKNILAENRNKGMSSPESIDRPMRKTGLTVGQTDRNKGRTATNRWNDWDTAPEYRQDSATDRIRLKYKIGQLNDAMGLAGSKSMDSGDNREYQARLTEMQDLIGKYPWIQNEPEARTFMEKVGRIAGNFAEAAAETAPSMMNTAIAGAKGAAIGAMTGAGAGFLAGNSLGVTLATPEEVLTVPGGAMIGAKIGGTMGAATQSFHVMRGHAYQSMIEDGISPEVAQVWANVVGTANAGIELVQLGTLAKSVKGLDAALKTVKNAPIGKYLSDIGKTQIGKYGIGVLSETGQEVAQELVSITGEAGANIQSGRDYQLLSKENWDRVVETAIQSAKAFAVLQGAGQLGGGAYRAAFNQSKKDVITAVNEFNAIEAPTPIDVAKIEIFQEQIQEVAQQTQEPFFMDAVSKLEQAKTKLYNKQMNLAPITDTGRYGLPQFSQENANVDTSVPETNKTSQNANTEVLAPYAPKEPKVLSAKFDEKQPLPKSLPDTTIKAGDKIETSKYGPVEVIDASDSAFIKVKNQYGTEITVGRKALMDMAQVVNSKVETTTKPDKINVNNLKIKDDMVDSHSGQVDMIMSAEVDGKIVGSIEYSIYNGKANISMIEVPEQYKRNGIAKKMLQQLQEQNPDTEIEWGMTTPEGTELKKAVTYTVENEETAPLFKEYEEVSRELARINNNIEKGIVSDEEGDKWNQLYDRQFELEKELRGKSAEKTFVKLDNIEPPQAETKTAEQTAQTSRFTPLTEAKNTKTGETVFEFAPVEKLPTEEWKQMLAEVRKLKGNYYNGKFYFKTNNLEDAQNKLQAVLGGTPIKDTPKPQTQQVTTKAQEEKEPKKNMAPVKLRQLADGLQKQIDEKMRGRLANTARRANMAAGAYAEGEALQKRQMIMRAIADDIESGTAKRAIANMSTRADIETAHKFTRMAVADFVNAELMAKFGNNYSSIDKDKITITNKAADYAQMPSVSGERLRYFLRDFEEKPGFKRDVASVLKRHGKGDKIYFHMYPEVVSLLEKAVKIKDGYMFKEQLAEFKRLQKLGITTKEGLQQLVFDYLPYYQMKGDNSGKAQRELKLKEQELARTKIDGFFPTPKKVVSQMLELANIQDGDKVLEPSAGAGSIADEIGVGKVDVVEWNQGLNNLLRDKGHNVIGDDVFTASGQYDKVVMNPPFEKLQDVDHVRHVYDNLLKPGGRIVAIMSESPFFRSDKKATEFRDWLDGIGYSEKLPDGSFKESDRSTGVSTRIVVIDKPAEIKSDIMQQLEMNGIAEKDGLKLKMISNGNSVFDIQALTVAPNGGAYRETVAVKFGTWEETAKQIERILSSDDFIKRTKEEITPKPVVQEKPQPKAEPVKESLSDIVDDPYKGLPEDKASVFKNLYTAKAYEKRTPTPTSVVSPAKSKANATALINDDYFSNGFWVIEKGYVKKQVRNAIEKLAEKSSKTMETKTIHDLMNIQKNHRDREITLELVGFNDTYAALKDPDTEIVISINKDFYDYFNNMGLSFKQFGGVQPTGPIGLYDKHKMVGLVLPVRSGVNGEKASSIVNLENNYPPAKETNEDTNGLSLAGFKKDTFGIKIRNNDGTDGTKKVEGLKLGDFAFHDGNITYIPEGQSINSYSMKQNNGKAAIKYLVWKLGERPTLSELKEFMNTNRQYKDLFYSSFDDLAEGGKGTDWTPDAWKEFVESTRPKVPAHLQGRDSGQMGIIAQPLIPIKSMEERYSYPEEIEARHRANRVDPPSMSTKLKESLLELRKLATRTFKELDENDPANAQIRNELIRYRSFKDQAAFNAAKMIEHMTLKQYSKLSFEEFNRYYRYIELRDLMEDRAMGLEIPDTYSGPGVLEALFEQLEGSLNDNIKAAVERRDNILEETKNNLIKAMRKVGFDLEDRFNKKNYFRHIVLEHYNAAREFKGSGSRVQSNKNRGSYKMRSGTNKEINEDYLQVEFQTLYDMLYDTYVAEMLDRIRKDYDITPKVKAEAKRKNKAGFRNLVDGEISDGLSKLSRDAQAQARGLDYKTLKKEFGVSSQLQEQETVYNQRIAIALGNITRFAQRGQLWDGDGKWAKAVRMIAEDVNAIANESKTVMIYLSALAEAPEESPGKIDALMFFSGVAKRENLYKKALGESYYQWKNGIDSRLIPEGYDTFQPIQGKHMMMVNTVGDEMVSAIMQATLGDTTMLQNLTGSKAKVREMLAYGQDRLTYVLPSHVTYTLENVYGKLNRERGLIEKGIGGSVRLWKQFRLQINPLTVPKYNIRNVTGDLDGLVGAGAGGALKYASRATKELFDVVKNGKFSPEMVEFMERGGLQSNIFVQEIYDANRLRLFKDFRRLKGIDYLKHPFETYTEFTSDLSQFREGILRYAAYLYYKEQFTKGGVTFFGASNPNIIKGLKDNKDKAYQMANDALGAYDQLTEMGQWLREFMIPFHSWNEVNVKRYFRIAKNAAEFSEINQALGKKIAAELKLKIAAKGLVKLGSIALKIMLVSAVIHAWNRIAMPDEDDKLPESIKSTPHITLGYDANTNTVIAFTKVGALTDFLEWFGLDTIAKDLEDLGLERKTFSEQIEDMVFSPVNKLINGITPVVKLPAELIFGQSIFPDVREPRTIRDSNYAIAQVLGLEKIYSKAMDLPMSKIKADIITDAFVYKYEPDTTAYYRILDLKGKFEEQVLGKSRSFSASKDKKAMSLYYMKLAMKYGDKDKAERYRQEYFENGGTSNGFQRSIMSMNPVYGLDPAEFSLFFEWLTPREREDLETAFEFFAKTLNQE